MKRCVEAWHNFSIEHLYPLLVLVGVFAFLNTHPIRPQDYWWHLAVGREILSSGQIPEVDIYSFTQAGAPYASYQQFWLMEVFMYLVFRSGGPVLTVLTQTALIFPAYAILLYLAYRGSANWRAAAFGVLFAAALGFGNWNVRPQAPTFLYAALILLAIERLRRGHGRGWLAVFPLVMALWVNSHGTFFFGMALVGIWGLQTMWETRQERTRHAWRQALTLPVAAGTLSIVGCLANPSGIGFVSYLTGMAGNPVIQQYIVEWQPSNFSTLDGTLFWIGAVLALGVLAFSPRRPTPGEWLTVLIFAGLGARYVRAVAWFGLVMAPVLAPHLAAWLERWLKRSPPVSALPARSVRGMNLAIAGLLLLLAFLSLPWFKSLLPLTPEKRSLISSETPLQAVDVLLEKQLPGPLFHSMDFGSYLIWKAYPQYRVFVDSRFELYTVAQWQEYLRLSAALDGWTEVLDRYGVNSLLLAPETQQPLIEAVAADANWQQVYADDAAVLFTRR